MKRIPIIEVPLNVYEHLVETAAIEGARRNIAMAHIIRQGDARAARDAAQDQLDVLLDFLWGFHPDVAEKALSILEERG
jgi:hypothetical protein